MRHSRARWRSLPTVLAVILVGCADDITYYGDEPEYHPLRSDLQVVYRPGDAIEYLYYGTLECTEGTYKMSGWFTILVSDQAITNPMNRVAVLTLIENQDLAIAFTGKDGKGYTATVNDYAYRYFVQDAKGTVKYYGDRIRDGKGAYFTVWFDTPYIPISSPFSIGQHKTVSYDRYIEDGSSTAYLDTQTTSVHVTGRDTVSTALGDFETYVMSWRDEKAGVLVRYQYVYPEIGIVKFVFPTHQPGCTGDVIMDMLDTNIRFGSQAGAAKSSARP